MKIFISYSFKEMSKIKNLGLLDSLSNSNPAKHPIQTGLQLKDNLVRILRKQFCATVFDYFTDFDVDFGWQYYKEQLNQSEIVVFLLGKSLSKGQQKEFEIINEKRRANILKDQKPSIFVYNITDKNHPHKIVASYKTLCEKAGGIIQFSDFFTSRNSLFKHVGKCSDGLPYDPYLFDYEKTILNVYNKIYFFNTIKPEFVKSNFHTEYLREKDRIQMIVNNGFPEEWPQVKTNGLFTNVKNRMPNLILDKVGKPRDFKTNRVMCDSLTKSHSEFEYLKWIDPEKDKINREMFYCPLKTEFTFPEAGPRKEIVSPISIIRKNGNSKQPKKFRVGIVVSGGTAPGINAVINGIVQRHFLYYDSDPFRNSYKKDERKNQSSKYDLEIIGFRQGLSPLTTEPEQLDQDFFEEYTRLLYDSRDRKDSDISRSSERKYRVTSKYIDKQGSILEVGRHEDLINSTQRLKLLNNILTNLKNNQIRILYIIGGEGSMKAARALSQLADNNKNVYNELSIIAIPKTIDNDVLWIWHTFGFQSAVNKATEFIDTISYELNANNRIGVVQLYGSFSGYVVSHAVLGSKSNTCDMAIIPELDFSIKSVAERVNENLQKYKKSMVVISETTFPVDIQDHYEGESYHLSEYEKGLIKKAIEIYNEGKSRVATRILIETSGNIDNQGTKLSIENEEGRKELQRKYYIGKSYKDLSHAILKLIANYLQSNCTGKPHGSEVLICEPKHLIRDVPPSPIDIIFGSRLATLAVDNALAGYKDFMISQWLTEFCLVPLELVVLGCKKIHKDGIFWKSVIAKTSQPENLL
ncbi:MAG: 6-phosphofructokinase [Bacteroidales bacterium]|nr:6-phosphofructokinase [Bacteroidales bacterium]